MQGLADSQTQQQLASISLLLEMLSHCRLSLVSAAMTPVPVISVSAWILAYALVSLVFILSMSECERMVAYQSEATFLLPT